jgi:colanic acid/amylovoran biosynthesis protein
MRILVDHSGYDLRNIGDIAMLTVAVERLREQWADAEITVVTHRPEVLKRYCPGTRAVRWANRNAEDNSPAERAALAGLQLYKIAAPYTAGAIPASRPGYGSGLVGELVRSDMVVAAGGGYLADPFWWHGAGVLSLLDAAQRLGKPTAMFGQGLGPLASPMLRKQARRVLTRLDIIGLREGTLGPTILDEFGVDRDRVVVTGDDAIELAVKYTGGGQALGLNLRVAAYSNVDDHVGEVVRETIRPYLERDGVPLIGLPVSRYHADSDLDSLRRMVDPLDAADVELQDHDAPERLAQATSRCRAVVTGSYHAAVFALAQGIPAVCLTNSEYYDVKFRGLADLSPGCSLVSTGPGFGDRLAAELRVAWDTSDAVRRQARDAAMVHVDRGRATYARFKELADGKLEARQELARI